MMSRVKSFLTLLALVMLSAVAIASSLSVARRGLADPVERSRQDMLAWITRRSVADAVPEERMRLARQFESDMRSTFDWATLAPDVAIDEHSRFNENVISLIRAWFVNLANEYHALKIEAVDTSKEKGKRKRGQDFAAERRREFRDRQRRELLGKAMTQVRAWRVPRAGTRDGQTAIVVDGGLTYLLPRYASLRSKTSADDRAALDDLIEGVRGAMQRGLTPNLMIPEGLGSPPRR